MDSTYSNIANVHIETDEVDLSSYFWLTEHFHLL